jgi:hypothetical protein
MKCPVADCGMEIPANSTSKGFKHFQKLDDFHRQLHWNWINFFYPDLVKSDYTDELKFRFAYRKWHENEKKQKIQAQKKKTDKNATDNITMKDGRVIYNGESYTPEQFANIQKGIKYMPVKMGK